MKIKNEVNDYELEAVETQLSDYNYKSSDTQKRQVVKPVDGRHVLRRAKHKQPAFLPKTEKKRQVANYTQVEQRITKSDQKQKDNLFRNFYHSQIHIVQDGKQLNSVRQFTFDQSKNLFYPAKSEKIDQSSIKESQTVLEGYQENLQKGSSRQSRYESQSKIEKKTEILSPQKVVPKSLQRFYKREREFNKLFQSQLQVWAKEREEEQKPLPLIPQEKGNFDTNLYKERQDTYPIIANQILHLSAQQSRPYFDKKNLEMLQQSFDPIRIRLRVIPITKAPFAKGRNPDYYFIEAGKKAKRGELTEAIELLKRGLILSPTHMLCRFSHGVIMFKFGLIIEAAQDFYELTQNYPKEALPHYNLAVSLMQMGLPIASKYYVPTKYEADLTDPSSSTGNQRYEMICELCQKAITITQNTNDLQLQIDCYFLHAVALYRLHKPLEAVFQFNCGNRIKLLVKETYQKTSEDLQQEYDELCLKEVEQQVLEIQNIDQQQKNEMLLFDLQKKKRQQSVKKKDAKLENHHEQKLVENILTDMKKQQDEDINGDSQLRFRQMYLNKNIKVKEGKFDGCNEKETEELISRRALENWLLDTKLLKQQVKFYLNYLVKEDTRLVDMILRINPLKQKVVPGTEQENALECIIEDQKSLVDKMVELDSNFEWSSTINDKELAENFKKIFQLNITEEEISMLTGQQKSNTQFKKNQKDLLILRLQEALTNSAIKQEDVCNLLANDLYEREKIRSQIAKQRDNTTSHRFSCKHLLIIEKELQNPANKRNLDFLDSLLHHLRYFSKQTAQLRKSFYRAAVPIKIKAQQTIFKQGDKGDYMYIILKGKVSVKIQMKDKADIDVLIAMPGDGECFGELSLYDFNKIRVKQQGTQKQEQGIKGNIDSLTDKSKLASGDNVELAPDVKQRSGTCAAVEETFCLRISHEEARKILQPSQVKEPIPELLKLSSRSSLSQKSNIKIDNENGRKIDFLKSCFEFFREIDIKLLNDIAVNMQQVNFSYGEYIQKEGAVPKGLYIIKSGQCNVSKTIISQREHNTQEIKGWRRSIKDKNPLFNDFDAESSILNTCKMPEKFSQNSRVNVTEDGKQVKNIIQYQNLLTYKKLAPKNWFGGRVIMPFELYMNQRRSYFDHNYVNRPTHLITHDASESDEHYQLKSFLNVIADSGVVETYLLTKMEMQYLPDSELNIIFDAISQIKEPDRPNTEEEVLLEFQRMINEEQTNINLVKNTIERLKIEKNK